MRATDESSTNDITVGPSATAALEGVGKLLVPTDASETSEAFGRTRRAARMLAQQYGFSVVLYDRSDERWTDTPHPEGPFGPDEVDLEKRPHLKAQMAEFTEAGIEVSAWYSSVPALTAIISAVQELSADAVLLPRELDDKRMMDRLQSGDASEMVGRVLDQNVEDPIHVFVLDDQANDDQTNDDQTYEVWVTTTEDFTDRTQAAPHDETTTSQPTRRNP
jgi:hypothetical protein